MVKVEPRPEPEPEAYSVEAFCKRFSIGKTQVYEDIKSGKLKSIKMGRRRLIPADWASEWWQNLRKAG
ncbi:excisionase family DNA-binding protein [Geothrix oryzisoli]|uniref:excisionase family DNA-binding protein n=1 Tax=Geothrix oryzisoli TaxID=2922721 RepID=UPI001FAD0A12|nr:excisionase family DNA-binding protein [Geothrix oryzisoli]